MQIDLKTWIKNHTIKDEMIYKNSAEGMFKYVNEYLRKLFDGSFLVVGEHTSKSIKLPVFNIIFNGVSVIMRNNFYDWKVSVCSEEPIENKALFKKYFGIGEKIPSIYCEGFEDSMVYEPYVRNKEKFTFSICSYEDLTKVLLVIFYKI